MPRVLGHARAVIARTPARVIGLVLALVTASAVAWAAPPPVPPVPTRWVTDTAGLLGPDTRAALDARLEAYQHATGHQVIVWIAPSLGLDNLEEWSARVFTAWGLGQKGKDDGVAIFVFPQDHALRIEVGYGLEERLPDLYVARIIDEAMKPELAAGHGDVAITNGVDQVLARIGGDPATANVAPLPPRHSRHSQDLPWWWIAIGIAVAIALLAGAATHPQLAWFLFDVISSVASRGGGGGWGGGGGGGGGGGFSGGGGRSGGGGASGHW